jgi:hypothetical protein
MRTEVLCSYSMASTSKITADTCKAAYRVLRNECGKDSFRKYLYQILDEKGT